MSGKGRSEKLPVARHLVWTEDQQTVCGIYCGWATLLFTDNVKHPELCKNCDRTLKAGKRLAIEDLNAD